MSAEQALWRMADSRRQFTIPMIQDEAAIGESGVSQASLTKDDVRKLTPEQQVFAAILRRIPRSICSKEKVSKVSPSRIDMPRS
jgi:hypothetical protein